MFKYEGQILNSMLSLEDFPFDSDDIRVLFTTMSRWSSYDETVAGKCPAGKTYRLRKVGRPAPDGKPRNEGRWIKLEDVGSIAEWTLRGISHRIEEREPNDAGSERTAIHLSFHVTRNASFYWVKVLFPLYMSVVLSFQVYIFDPFNLSDRVATTAVYVLRRTLVNKPEDLNQDWSLRFSTLRDKNGWIRAKAA